MLLVLAARLLVWNGEVLLTSSRQAWALWVRYPECHRIDHVEQEDPSDTANHWWLCARCGRRFTAPP